METKHTPGPWTVASPDEISVNAGTEGRVAILTNLRGALGMKGRRDPNEVIANARLIATAPELLEALQHAIDWLNAAGVAETMPVQQQARAALAKATGEQS